MATSKTTEQSAVAAKAQADALTAGKVDAWCKELAAASKREKDWRATAANAVKLYEGEMQATNPYNILYSNTETISPALYNNLPTPVVKARFVQKENALTRLAALTAQRMLRFQLDTNNPGSVSFDELMKDAVTKALVPGRGVARVKYSAVFEAAERAAGEVEEAEAGEAPEETVAAEALEYELVPWDSFLHGFATSWTGVPWVSFEHNFTHEELEENFGKDMARKVALASDSDKSSDNSSDDEIRPPKLFGRAKGAEDEKNTTPTCQVFEIWHKFSRKVFFISPSFKDAPLKVVEDPLRLQTFWPMPEPLKLFRRVQNLTPKVLYKMYEEQAVELNDLTIRITRIVKAMKVRGYYMGAVEGMKDLLTADDNTMLPITNAAQLMGQGIKLDDAVWLMPIEKLVAVLQQLVMQREQVKGVIFEIMGIADIMRGSSQASETLGAQKLKNQWGSMRLKRMQKEVATFAREMLRLSLEMMVTHLSPETIRAMTGLPFPTRTEKQQMQLELQQVQASIPPGAEPPPELQQAMVTAQAPALEDIIDLLKDDNLRNFAVDIETNSTVDAEATDDKADMAELMNALAQFLNGVAPLVESGTMPFEAAQKILLHLLQRFRMGGEVEEAILAIQPPSKGGEAEAEQLKQMQEALAKEKEALEQEKLDLETAKRTFEQDKQFAERELQHKTKLAEQELQAQVKLAQQQIQAAAKEVQQQAQAQYKEMDAEHKRTVAQREIESGEKIRQQGLAQEDTLRQSQKAVEDAKPQASGQPLVLNITIDGKTGAVKRSMKVQRDAQGNLIGADVEDSE